MLAETQSPAPSRIPLIVILVGFFLLATIYSLATPLFEASDEVWHYPLIEHLADNGLRLPVQDPANPGLWRQEGGQPPLYYFIGAVATFWIDTDDVETVRRINPHADIGVIVPDGNANIIVHHDERESFPWSGTVLAVHIVRLLSVLMATGTVFLTYLLGRELFPKTPIIALSAAVFTAFNPMFLFISGVVNNDNLSNLLGALLLVLVVRLVKRTEAPGWQTYALLGVAAGAGMLAKYQIGFMLLLIALALLVLALRLRDWRPLVVGGAISGGLTILIAGWWYWRNYDLYGDATGINVFLDIVGRRAVPADLHQLWTEREAFMMAFWGFFGGVNVSMSDLVYTLFNAIAGLAILGLLWGMVQRFTKRKPSEPPDQIPGLGLARLVAAIWPLVVFVSLLSWTRQTWASQGRLLFAALGAINVWIAVGLANWSRSTQRFNLGITALAFVGIAIMAPFTAIRPAYQLDRNATWGDDAHETSGTPRAVCFSEGADGPEVLCMAARPVEGSVLPGEYVLFAPTMTVKNSMASDYSLFVHLVNPDGLIEAQRDVYPGMGLLATSDLEAGESWNNLIAVHIPEGIYTPQELDVYLGLYDRASGERLIPSGQDVDAENQRAYLGRVRLETPAGDVPNPVDVNFGGLLRLRGYEVSARALAPGDTTTLTLYWEPLETLEDYVISVQIINPDTLTKATQEDRPPDPATSMWQTDEPITTTHTLPVFEEAGPGRYRVMVRLYPVDDAANPVRIRSDAGGQSEDFVWLSWVQVQ